jgi:Ca2+-binding EF-hand superfamily protein
VPQGIVSQPSGPRVVGKGKEKPTEDDQSGVLVQIRALSASSKSSQEDTRSDPMIQKSHLIQAVVISLAFTVPSIALAQNDALAAENYQQADANGDGHLAFEEFASFIDLNAADGIGNAHRVSSRGLHAKAFKRVDADGNGLVTPEELSKLKK